jgi:hypothetical protein
MPTKPAAIHSIVSMKRSIEARCISPPLPARRAAAGGPAAAIRHV